MKMPLYNYRNCFGGDTKLRPAFMVDGRLFCLSHTSTGKGTFKIPSTLVLGEHFSTSSRWIYIRPGLKKASRYNNISGGYLKITPPVFMYLQKQGVRVKSLILTTNFSQHMKIKDFLIGGFVLPSQAQVEMGIPAERIKLDTEGNQHTADAILARAIELEVNDPMLTDLQAEFLPRVYRLSLAKAIELCPGVISKEEALAAVEKISNTDLPEALAAFTDVLSGNPYAGENTKGAEGVLALLNFDISVEEAPYKAAPASAEDVAKALEEAQENTEETLAAAPIDAPVTEDPATPPTKEISAEENLPALPAEPVVVIPGKEKLVEAIVHQQQAHQLMAKAQTKMAAAQVEFAQAFEASVAASGQLVQAIVLTEESTALPATAEEAK